ncbi:NlpC/P60 family protein [Streptacidiphilus sp. EB129]|uniref:C40 family peptidase n=1 Tax=Streptacidiphilus sp. EB129 TaxID=3156262 RepID=UPI00351315FE
MATSSSEGAQVRLGRLYIDAQHANAASCVLLSRLHAAQEREQRLLGRLASLRARLKADREQAGQMAAAQYRDRGIPALGQVILAPNAEHATQAEDGVDGTSQSEKSLVSRLKTDQGAVTATEAEQAALTTLLRSLATAHAHASQEANRDQSSALQALAQLTGQHGLQARAFREAPAPEGAWAVASSSNTAEATPSAAGARVVAYAFAQLGKPYRWGATGPGAFDCSGLTSQAWAHAGTHIPRTSEAQWNALPHLSNRQLRPGDLIVYSRASHIALYIGAGLVIQAPHTGSFVKATPMALEPVTGIVRPDPHSASLL